RQRELRRRIVPARADEDLVAVERAQGGEAARDRRRGEAGGPQSRRVCGELLGSRVRDGAGQAGREVLEVTPVGVDRARREPRHREREKGLDRRVHRRLVLRGPSATCLIAPRYDRGCEESYTLRSRLASTWL